MNATDVIDTITENLEALATIVAEQGNPESAWTILGIASAFEGETLTQHENEGCMHWNEFVKGFRAIDDLGLGL
jgi:hypothetical protein